MSDEPELDALERRLDAAFASARPRPGFADELWTRLEARRPWWRRLSIPAGAAGWAAAAAVAVLMVGFGISPVHPGGGAAGQSGSAPQDRAASAFSKLPRPGGGAGMTAAPTANFAGADSAAALYTGRFNAVVTASLPTVSPTVTRTDRNGTVATAAYPLASAASLAASARVQAAAAPITLPDGEVPTVTLDRAAAATVTVPDGDVTYSEPVVVFSGGFDYKGRHFTVRITVPAVDPADLR